MNLFSVRSIKAVVMVVAALSLETSLARGQEKKEGAQESARSLPAGVLARVGGKDVTFQEYSQYLYSIYGKTKLNDLIDRILIEEEARRLGIAVTPEEVEKEVQAQIEKTLRGLYQGDQAKLEANLKQRSMTLDDHKEKLRQEAAYSLLRDAAVIKTRAVSEADLKQQFEKVYGEGGVRLELRHLLIATRDAKAGGTGDKGDAGANLPSDQEAREKAEKILKELRGGADFIQMVKTYSDDILTKRNDGRIPIYYKNYYGEEFHQAVLGLTEESRLSGVVKSPRGFHIVYLVRREKTNFEDKKAEVLEFLKTQPPATRERQEFLKALRAKAKIEQ
ncbi:MAG: peptidylprolyl isomerase [Planctomycetes bacterium]|nr:peptidylprolyl isomerase [Planctomycetota bacterium]